MLGKLGVQVGMKARGERVRMIGEVAAELGVEAHVLRHWEQVGALMVRRDGKGYRVYDDETLERARTVLKLRRVGLSLPEVTAAMAPTKAAAQAVVRAKIAGLEREMARTQHAITFLQHTVECRHRFLDDCPDCAAFAREP
ncbi:MerR family transcriptional regulator [Streptomyces sp. N2-109]|uniref:MerR family transcriptional regulator n=1 Tax=Streptomyces gossypii TaxID=2883101 RepID=A0ABT2K3E1_9ACTN|nr:MerR family transcriptional regulator [Streptomyces gossypii]MCT2594668.1 MerR family transcriptional regulator [Streptomyces gossypii]